MSLYDELQKKYGLTDKYPVIPFEEEQILIKKYQNPKTNSIEKARIIEFFWEANKSRIVNQAIKSYNYLQKIYHGDISVGIEDLINKGYRAIPHCLNIYHKAEKREKESVKDFSKRKQQIESARFGTLLQWWIKPFMMQHINQENFIIYVPHSKFSDKKSASVLSLDTVRYDNEKNKKTFSDFLISDAPTPDQITEKHFFWNSVKEALTKEEYDFLMHWMFIDKYFESKKEFYNFYKTNNIKTKTRLNEIYKKLKPVMKSYQGE